MKNVICFFHYDFVDTDLAAGLTSFFSRTGFAVLVKTVTPCTNPSGLEKMILKRTSLMTVPVNNYAIVVPGNSYAP